MKPGNPSASLPGAGEVRDAGLHKEEEISISCLGRSSSVLRRLLGECRAEYLSRIKYMTTVFENRGDTWVKATERETRPLSTVILGERQKRQLVDDIKGFLDAETRRWFARRAIPYRRGYLLYGPPGTGKSSFSLSVAGELRLDMYMVSVPGVGDQMLRELFSKLPPRCVVMLEDIDAVGSVRIGEVGDAAFRSGTSLSGLLNTLDGVASQEGRILIMTTNHVERLDEALIRPGRVDVKAEFRLADATMAMKLFDFVFQPDDAKEKVNKVELELSALAARFAALVPEHELSPAEMISYLQRHRHSPVSAVEKAPMWVAEIQREKRERLADG
ncbi:mitochondrial chaperone BCS1 [Ophiocordyceps camponoti-floridani]|uniref:Mitochondrial chaperone BCS1 n=1 Tax=Ophiocordyceps camponoti-floridani TaxID=2030778 RepID=A0A8H4Q2E2_9HYPO|nr:mitochondrial chaperone BCS1 [Ophiocordyceps camponoti-floridani]